MIPVPSEIEGREAIFGKIQEPFQQAGFILGGNWEYDSGYFDAALERDGGETIYLRLPVKVLSGALDDGEARLKFLQPLLLRHVANTGLMEEDNSLPVVDQMMPTTSSLVNQFQKPLKTDGEIHDEQKRLQKAQTAISKIMPYVH